MKEIKQGDKITDFQAINQYGECVKLSQFYGKKLIIFFYPKALTTGCVAQVCNLRDGYSLLKEKGYELLGVSADSMEKQLKFSEKYNLSFPLLSDENKEIINQFGVWGTKKFMGKIYNGIHRKTFIIDENQIITHIIDKVKTKHHTAQLLEILSI